MNFPKYRKQIRQYNYIYHSANDQVVTMKKIIPFSVFLVLSAVCGRGYAQAYFGEARPGATPKLFAPGKISDGMPNRDMAISPSGDELFYTVQSPRGQLSCILYARFAGGTWSKPEVADFCGIYSDLEPAFSADGGTLYFSSNRPVGGSAGSAEVSGAGGAGLGDAAPKDYDIWMVKKNKAGKWLGPVRLDTVINTTKDEFYPSIARSGNLYFTREMENGKGKEDIVISEWKDGKFQAPYSLPEAINSDKYEFNAFVDPDEQYLLFTSFGRADDLGGGDLYLSYKNAKGEWMQAVHLDSTINTTSIEFCPFVSFDKKYLFFTSSRMDKVPPFKKQLDFHSLQELLQGPGNGLPDIYWMDWKSLINKYTHGF
jgi:hypothetical protein